MDVELTAEELNMISTCYRLQLAEMGVDPNDASTYQNATAYHGYDSSNG